MSALKWAHSPQANVREPIEQLKDKGWHYGDIPTAANFNWLFKVLTEEIANLQQKLVVQHEELNRTLAKQAEEYEDKLNTKAHVLDNKFTSLSERHTRSCEFNEGISRQIVMLLKEMEKHIRHYHKEFPTLPWPLLSDTEINNSTNGTKQYLKSLMKLFDNKFSLRCSGSLRQL